MVSVAIYDLVLPSLTFIFLVTLGMINIYLFIYNPFIVIHELCVYMAHRYTYTKNLHFV